MCVSLQFINFPQSIECSLCRCQCVLLNCKHFIYMPLMRIAISFWTFFNISSDKTDPFCALFCNRFYSETEEINSWHCIGQTPVLSPSYLILYIFLNVSILFHFFQRKM